MHRTGFDGVVLAKFSLYTFLGTMATAVGAGILAVLSLDAGLIGNHGATSALRGVVRVLLLGAAILNGLALFTGTLAWRGRGHECPWILINGALFLGTILFGFHYFRVGY